MANELGNKLMSTISLDDLSKLIAPPTIINGSISSERSYAAVTLPMSRMKAIVAKSGTKLNDVVLAVASGVLRGGTFWSKARSLRNRLQHSCPYRPEKRAIRPLATRLWA